MKAIESAIQPICDWIFHGTEWLTIPKFVFAVGSWCLFVAGFAIALTWLYDLWRDERDFRMDRRNRWANYKHWYVDRNLNGKWEG